MGLRHILLFQDECYQDYMKKSIVYVSFIWNSVLNNDWILLAIVTLNCLSATIQQRIAYLCVYQRDVQKSYYLYVETANSAAVFVQRNLWIFNAKSSPDTALCLYPLFQTKEFSFVWVWMRCVCRMNCLLLCSS